MQPEAWARGGGSPGGAGAVWPWQGWHQEGEWGCPQPPSQPCCSVAPLGGTQLPTPPGMELELWGKKAPWEEHPLALGGASLEECVCQPWGEHPWALGRTSLSPGESISRGKSIPWPQGGHLWRNACPSLRESIPGLWGEHPWRNASFSLRKSIPWPQGEPPSTLGKAPLGTQGHTSLPWGRHPSPGRCCTPLGLRRR